MTPTQEAAMRQALEALEFLSLDFFMLDPISPGREAGNKAITALRAALAEPPVQEPVAWRIKNATPPVVFQQYPSAVADLGGEIEPLYTAPPQRKPLTEEEIIDAVRDADLDWARGWALDETQGNRFATLARAIERAHGIGGEA